MKSLLCLIFAALILSFLSGCTSIPKPPIAQLSLNVQKNVNPRVNEKKESESRPIVIRVYELKSLATFNESDFFSVRDHYREVLSNELLNSEEFYLVPNQKLRLTRPLNLDTRYIGVVAAFREIETAQWRASTAVPVDERFPEIYILLVDNKVLIGAKPECGFFCKLWAPKPPAGSLYEVIEQTEY